MSYTTELVSVLLEVGERFLAILNFATIQLKTTLSAIVCNLRVVFSVMYVQFDGFSFGYNKLNPVLLHRSQSEFGVRHVL